MGAWKDRILTEYEAIYDDLAEQGLSDDQIWLAAEDRAREHLADMADMLRDRAKEAR